MDIRLSAAKGISSILTWGLRHIARRPAANTPGLVGLKIDPHLIEKLRTRMHSGSIVVVGTNGKTTVTNLLANTMELAGRRVVCNRTGANLNGGIASALLHSKDADWGVLECDELWSAKMVPQLKPTYYLLLNLFRDQLDRCGEIDHIQDAIVSALANSPDTCLIYNADDPLCAMVAARAAAEPSRKTSPASIAFGVSENMSLEQNVVADATMCQKCSHMFEYEYRQYGQLGVYKCPNCGFTRPTLDMAAQDIKLHARGIDFQLKGQLNGEAQDVHIEASLSGSYMVYNLTAVSTAAIQSGCKTEAVMQAIREFNPKNGRLQEYSIQGRRVLLNLAKNPTGFNQNLRIVEADKEPKAVAFFINDQVVDGHDISWIWDIDFEELVSQPNIRVFAGGNRKNDLQVRLKYAGVHAELIDDIEGVFANIAGEAGLPVYAIANYTALPPVKHQLDKMESAQGERDTSAEDGTSASASNTGVPSDAASTSVNTSADDTTASNTAAANPPISPHPATHTDTNPVRIVHMLPDLLNLYGDGGNVRILEQRLNWRGIPVEVQRVKYGDTVNLTNTDLMVLGGSPDKEQRLASEELVKMRDDLAAYVEDDGPMLAICGSYQMLGRTWLLDDEEVPGLGILGIETRRPGTSTDRLISNIALEVPFAKHPVIGFENHAGRTYLDENVQPFGRVISDDGVGNSEEEPHADGAVYKGVIGTYLHGPILSKNPEVADHLLQQALVRKARREDTAPIELEPLDDSEELAANAFMARTWAL